MSCISSQQPSRRLFLSSAAAFFFVGTTLARARTIAGGLPWQAGTATPPVVVRPGPWWFFTADEAAVIEAAVDRLIPPDNRAPGGKDAGCAVFIDRQLAGPYGRAEGLYMRPPFMPAAATQGYQLPRLARSALSHGLESASRLHQGQFRRQILSGPCAQRSRHRAQGARVGIDRIEGRQERGVFCVGAYQYAGRVFCRSDLRR